MAVEVSQVEVLPWPNLMPPPSWMRQGCRFSTWLMQRRVWSEMSTQLSLRFTCPLLMLSFSPAQKSGFSVRPNISRWEMTVPSSAA